jgi:subtilase family serine protease
MDELNNAHTQLFVPHALGDLPEVSRVGTQPDLVVTQVRVARQADGSGDCALGQDNFVLVRVENLGAAAGPFTVRFTVRGVLKAETGTVPGLDPGAAADLAIPTDDMTHSDQSVKAIADYDNQVAEADETNNALAINAHCT